MNPQHLNYNHNQTSFLQEKQKWEHAISSYKGPDPLDLWHNFICWYETNVHLDHERLFETALGKCLSIFECQQHYNQDTRLVKLWMKYIGLKSNPLNLYQVLYQRGIGTQCSIFYIGWAHYYDAANAFKQAESVYNLGFQANAQPYDDLDQAHKRFRFSLSQRMLYSDQQTKKRTQSQLNDQRQQITTLNSSNSSPNAANVAQPNNYVPPSSMNQQRDPYVPQHEPSSQIQQQQQQQQPPPQLQSAQQSIPNSYPEYGASPEPQPSSKRFRPSDSQQLNYNQNYSNATPDAGVQIGFNNGKSIDYNNHYNSASINNGTNSNSSPAHAIACSLNSVYSGDEDQASEDYNSYSNYPGANDKTPDFNNDTLTYSQVNNKFSTTSTIEPNESLPNGCTLPENHVSYASNKHETWDMALFLDEPDANKICKYPRHLVYPGNGCEYSLEEIRSRNYTKVIEAIKERNRQREIALNEQRHFGCMQHQHAYHHHHQQQQQQQAQHQHHQQVEHARQMSFHQQQLEKQKQQTERERLAEIERERLAEMERERERVMKERERQRLAEIQRAKEQEEAQRQRMIEQQKMQQMQEQQQQQYQYQSGPYQSGPPNHHQSIQADQHQPVNNHSYYHPPSSGYNNGAVAQPQINHHPHQQQDYGNYPAQSHPSHYQPQQPPAPPYYNNQRPIQQTSPMQYHSSSGIDQNEMYKSQQQSRITYPSHHNQLPVQQPPATPHTNSNPPMQSPYQEQHYNNNYQPQNPPQQQQFDYHRQSYQAPPSVQPAIPNNHTVAPKMNGDTVTEMPPLNNYVDDIEEQIEASTIVLKNGSSKPQKITIKYRKEKSGNEKQVPLTDPLADVEKTPKTKKSKKSKAKLTDLSFVHESDNSNLLNDEIDDQCNESMSNDSYSTPITASKLTKSKKSKKATKFEPSFLQNDESCSNSDFATLYGKYSNGDTEEKAPNGSRNVRFNFAGATSTPTRNNNNIYQSPSSSAKATHQSNESSSKSSTPRNTYRSLRRRASNGSLLSHTFNENDDSMTSFSMVEPNSFFETENNDELLQQRLDKAMKTIDEHFNRPHIDPFSSELCKALLVKADFPSREHSEFYILSNALLSKLSNTRTVMIHDTRFNVDKEIGRGAYGNVYRGTNVNTGDVVALKYQKPPNTWELYICTEVAQRIKDPNLLLGYMDISSAMIAPNASIFVSEFSQFGSLLDINNRIRQNTTKVMHESLVMHFTSQILNIVHHLHSSQIIHGDIKPDNFLLMKIPNPNSGVPTLRLIDFGCAIDMEFFKPNTQFKKIVQTDGFTCPEMLEGRPWSYQTDIFCVAGTVHVMLFGDYMQMLKNSGRYDIKQKLPRYLKKHIWTEFFSSFLNIKDNHSLPNLLKMKEKIDNELCGMESELQSQIRTLSNILYKR